MLLFTEIKMLLRKQIHFKNKHKSFYCKVSLIYSTETTHLNMYFSYKIPRQDISF